MLCSFPRKSVADKFEFEFHLRQNRKAVKLDHLHIMDSIAWTSPNPRLIPLNTKAFLPQIPWFIENMEVVQLTEGKRL